MKSLRFPARNFRSLPSPNGGTARAGLFYCACNRVPAELFNWREVNPREVKTNGGVFARIQDTLANFPERFHERNRGITLMVDEISYDDKTQTVIIGLSDKAIHGVVDGAHTLRAILDAQENPDEEETLNRSHVFIKACAGIDATEIPEIAGGLNTSQQVDSKSLANLEGLFEPLKTALAGTSYEDKIAYRMNEPESEKPIDAREILLYLAVLDKSKYTEIKHPVALFGRKEGLVRELVKQEKDPASSGMSFRILFSRAQEILELRDKIEQAVVTRISNIGKYNSTGKSRVKSKKNAKNPLHFLGTTVNGKVSLGWILPMLGAFRANIQWDESNDTFEWIVPIDSLLEDSIEALFSGIKEIHERENSRPEYVGRSATAWRVCYDTVDKRVTEQRLRTLLEERTRETPKRGPFPERAKVKRVR